MKRPATLLIGALILGLPLMIFAGSAKAGDILEWDMMAGVPEDQFTIRGVDGGGSPWVVDVARGSVSDAGDLEVTVRGLVLRDTGMNPSATFSGVVSCLDGSGFEVNTFTAAFPADEAGNAQIRETLALPNPCFAPIVFVTGASGNWFAVTGGGPFVEEAEAEEPEGGEIEDEED